MIVILSAPSGGGKTSISKKILDEDKNIKLSISVTTRNPRSDEKEAIDYFFKTIAEFQELKNTDEFVEYAEVYGNFYGTPKKYVNEMLAKGHDVLFDIDHQGAQQIKQKLLDQVVSIFIVPPSIEALRDRLESRGQDSDDDIEKRLKLAEEVISHSDNYDYVVVNDNFDQAVKEIQEIIKKEHIERASNEKE
ncbi:MAG: guanylate kinase [Pseudomonadota bacterium]